MTRRTFLRTAACLPLLAAGLCAQSTISFVFEPDLHLGATNALPAWKANVAWILANRTTYNVQAFVQTGDWGSNGTDGMLALGWADTTDGNKGLNQIDSAGLAYLTTVGNHDYESNNLDTTTFDAQVGYSRVSAHTYTPGGWGFGNYYAAPWGTNKSTEYIKLDVGARKFLILSIEYISWIAHGNYTLTWAAGVINANPDREVIIISHNIIDSAGVWAGGSTFPDWVSQFPNVRLLLGGHNTNIPPYTAHTMTSGTYKIPAIFANWQGLSFPSRNLLLLTISSGLRVRYFDGTTGVEDTASAYSLPWGPPSRYQGSWQGALK